MNSPPRYAGVAVADEAPFEPRPDRVIDHMMDDPVPEIRRQDFANFRARDDKGNAATNPVAPFAQVVPQVNQVLFEHNFERKLIERVALVFAAVEIGVEDRFESQGRGRGRGRDSISGRIGRRLYCSYCCCSGCRH